VGAIDEGLRQIDLTAVAQIFGESFYKLPEHARLDPLLHPAVNRLIRRVLARKRFPRCSGPKDPEHSVENVASFDARATFPVFANGWLRNQSLDNTPLLVGELHGLLDHIRDPDAIASDHVLKNRSNFDHLQIEFLRCVLVRTVKGVDWPYAR
jgi:hypothetical protein